jgi:hypothetical protein
LIPQNLNEKGHHSSFSNALPLWHGENSFPKLPPMRKCTDSYVELLVDVPGGVVGGTTAFFSWRVGVAMTTTVVALAHDEIEELCVQG